MNISEISTFTYFKTWGLFLLVSVIGSGLAAGVSGFVVGFVYGIVARLTGGGVDLVIAGILGAVVGVGVSLPISFLTFRWAVNRMIKKAFPQNVSST